VIKSLVLAGQPTMKCVELKLKDPAIVCIYLIPRKLSPTLLSAHKILG